MAEIDGIDSEVRSSTRRLSLRALSNIMPEGNVRVESAQIADLAILEAADICRQNPEKNIKRVAHRLVQRYITQLHSDPYRFLSRATIDSAACIEDILKIIGHKPTRNFTSINITLYQRKDLNSTLRHYRYNVSILGRNIKIKSSPSGLDIMGNLRCYIRPVDFPGNSADDYSINNLIDQHSYNEWRDNQSGNEASESPKVDPDLLLHLSQCIMFLNSNRRHFLIESFGLWGCEQSSTFDLAKKYGLTPRNIRYEIDKALAELKEIMSRNDDKATSKHSL